MTNEVWVLPEEHNYAVEFWNENRWVRRMEYGTYKHMKTVALDISQHTAVRVIKVSRYDPHPATSVVFYTEAQQQ